MFHPFNIMFLFDKELCTSATIYRWGFVLQSPFQHLFQFVEISPSSTCILQSLKIVYTLLVYSWYYVIQMTIILDMQISYVTIMLPILLHLSFNINQKIWISVPWIDINLIKKYICLYILIDISKVQYFLCHFHVYFILFYNVSTMYVWVPNKFNSIQFVALNNLKQIIEN